MIQRLNLRAVPTRPGRADVTARCEAPLALHTRTIADGAAAGLRTQEGEQSLIERGL